MKLLFPNGERPPFELKDGVTRVGSGAGNDLTIAAPGIADRHCEITLQGEGCSVRPLAESNVVVVNGRQAGLDTPIKPGDLVLFARVGARVVAVERSAAAPVPRRSEGEDDGRTRVRMALPKYLLRGVSGGTFGKVFPLVGTMTVGRHSDCDISVPGEEISRHHARLSPMPDGVAVEDLGSANGTFIADKRIQQGLLKPGEELRLDTLRFLLVAPGLAAQSVAAPAPAPASIAGGGGLRWVAVAMAVIALAAVGAWVLIG
ncbi:MAG: FHA domain-containing protein [Pseudomonadota bacterium]